MNEPTRAGVSRREAVRLFGFGGLGLLLGGAASRTAGAQHSTPTVHAEPAADRSLQGAGFYQLPIGQAKVTLLSDGGFPMQPTSLFPQATPSQIEEAAKAAFVSPKTVPGHVNGLLIEAGNDKILVDGGTGGLMGNSSGHLGRNLGRAGLKPDDITHLVVTHAHPDHIGGLLDADGKPRFARAKVHVNEAEHAFWTADDPRMPNAAVPEEMKRMMVGLAQRTFTTLRDQLVMTKPEALIGTVVTVIDAAGHTPGHIALRVDSGNESLLYVTDAVHLPALQMAHPEWHVMFDADPTMAASARRRLLDMAARDRQLIAGAHIPFPALGYVEASGSGYRWNPRVWEW